MERVSENEFLILSHKDQESVVTRFQFDFDSIISYEQIKKIGRKCSLKILKK